MKKKVSIKKITESGNDWFAFSKKTIETTTAREESEGDLLLKVKEMAESDRIDFNLCRKWFQ